MTGTAVLVLGAPLLLWVLAVFSRTRMTMRHGGIAAYLRPTSRGWMTALHRVDGVAATVFWVLLASFELYRQPAAPHWVRVAAALGCAIAIPVSVFGVLLLARTFELHASGLPARSVLSLLRPGRPRR